MSAVFFPVSLINSYIVARESELPCGNKAADACACDCDIIIFLLCGNAAGFPTAEKVKCLLFHLGFGAVEVAAFAV